MGAHVGDYTRDLCFFNVISPEFRDNVSVTFIDNTAGGPGSSLYGLWTCGLILL